MLKLFHKHFGTIDSTNTWAKQNCLSFARDGITIVTADTQTAGRGRYKRVWVSPPKENIYATFCHFVSKSRVDIGNIPQLLALAVYNVVEHYTLTPRLKWPNDVLVSSKKIGGILCETVSVEEELCVITGVGLNVNMPKETLLSIDRPATSLFAETGKEHNVSDVMTTLEQTFVPMLEKFLSEGFSPFLQQYKERQLMKQGDPVRFHDNQHIVEGFFGKINEDGSLTLLQDNGEETVYLSGEFL